MNTLAWIGVGCLVLAALGWLIFAAAPRRIDDEEWDRLPRGAGSEPDLVRGARDAGA